MKASAVANANIALVKYWGKRDEDLFLPLTSSISMTTEGLSAHTTIEFDEGFEEDVFILNGKAFEDGSQEYGETIGSFLRIVRETWNVRTRAKIVSRNNFPTAAGLASSAAGYAALAAAVNEALGLGLDGKGLSVLARRGSGSASRSIFAGFVEWKRGERDDGTDSFAEPIAPPEHWPEFRMVVCLTSMGEKTVKSRAGMASTVKTSPFYGAWLDSVGDDLHNLREGVLQRDFSRVGETAEANALKMHATMLTARPAILYWMGETMEIMRFVRGLRDAGLECYFTIDAGPQVKILCRDDALDEILDRLEAIKDSRDILVTRPGKGATTTAEHLF